MLTQIANFDSHTQAVAIFVALMHSLKKGKREEAAEARADLASIGIQVVVTDSFTVEANRQGRPA